MKYGEDFMSLMRQARAARQQFVGGVLRRAWNAALDIIRRWFSQFPRARLSGRQGLAKLLSS
jgi:hypothetical protein